MSELKSQGVHKCSERCAKLSVKHLNIRFFSHDGSSMFYFKSISLFFRDQDLFDTLWPIIDSSLVFNGFMDRRQAEAALEVVKNESTAT